MALPYIDISKNEGSARPLTSAASKALIIGPCSSGVKESRIYTFGNAADVQSTIGYGPAQEAAQLFMSLAPAGFGSVDVIVANGAGEAITTVSATSPTITPSGTPYSSYDLRAEVATTGITGSAKFKYSLDGGNTYTENIQMPLVGTYTIPNTGLLLTFAAGTHTAGNSCHFDIQGPQMSTTHLANCITTLSTSNVTHTVILPADLAVSPVSGAALFNAMDGHLTSLDNTYSKYTQAVVGVGGESKKFNRSASLTGGAYIPLTVKANITGSAASTGNFISAVAEQVNTYLASPQPGFSRPRRPFAWSYAAECHAVGSNISKNPSVDKIRRVETPSYDDYLDGTVYHDEKIVAPRTMPGEAGIFCNQGKLKSAANSTYDIWPKGRVTSRAAEVVRAATRPFLNQHVRVLTDGTGRIDPRDKVRIETAVNKALRAALLTPSNEQGSQGYCTDVLFSINGETNILSTGALEGTTMIIPFAYISSISIDIVLVDTFAVNPVAG